MSSELRLASLIDDVLIRIRSQKRWFSWVIALVPTAGTRNANSIFSCQRWQRTTAKAARKWKRNPFRENQMLKTSTIIMAAVAIFGTAQLASAQGYYPSTHYDNVPHTTTHTDYVRHGNHVDAVPHTTTHIDRVPHTTFRPINRWNPRPNYVPHTTTHTDYIPHGNHVDAVPHTTTHWDRVPQYRPRYVPHTTTHFDRVRHGNHSHVVPHTTTHFDRR